MMVGVLSDTHGNWEWAERAVSQMGKLDLLLHAGDYYRDAIHLGEFFPVELHAVAGNCDRSIPGPPEEVLQIQGLRVLLAHGHRYGVKRSLRSLYWRAHEVGAGLVVYGHTHIEQNEVVRGIRFINPGCTGSYALLEFTEKGYTAKLYGMC